MLPEVFLKSACEEGRRCTIPDRVPDSVRRIMERGWEHEPSLRPDFSEIVPVLEAALSACTPAVPIGNQGGGNTVGGKPPLSRTPCLDDSEEDEEALSVSLAGSAAPTSVFLAFKKTFLVRSRAC